MQNSVVVFTFFDYDQKCPFWTNLVQKVKIINLTWNVIPKLWRIQKVKIISSSWNLVPKLIGICRTQWSCSLFSFSIRNAFFWADLGQNVKLVSTRWNLMCRLIWKCRTQRWCSLFLFLIRNTLFGQIWSKTSKLTV